MYMDVLVADQLKHVHITFYWFILFEEEDLYCLSFSFLFSHWKVFKFKYNQEFPLHKIHNLPEIA